MARTDFHVPRPELVEAFSAAALGAGSWPDTLHALALDCGGRSGQLIGVGADATVPFNWVTNIDPEAIVEFAQTGGGDPLNNPRVRAGMRAPELQVLTECDYADPDVLRRTPIYADFFTRHDIPFICQASLIKSSEMLIGLSVLRSSRQGHAEEADRRLFGALAPHVQAAVRLQTTLESKGAHLIAGAMEALDKAVFVLDGLGYVRALTQAAETLVGGGGRLVLRGRRLQARLEADSGVLEPMIRNACLPLGHYRPAEPAVLTEDAPELAPLVIEVASLPRLDYTMGFEPRAIVVADLPGEPRPRSPRVLEGVFGLTPSESAVAAALHLGLGPGEVAIERGVSEATVRVQIRSIFAKTGATRQGDLLVRLRPYLG